MGSAYIAVLALIGVGVLLDQLLLWFERRGWMYWRKTTAPGGGGAAGMFGEMANLFTPSNRHVVEEMERNRIVRAETAIAGDIDLDGGKVWIEPRDQRP
ncbi:hypothetical protein [Aldersonia kunmingensis]|uniref:hypothetical protein n=1 Tax=Aldersonia kunmingensis TaxID=408066 RepID=UPI0008308055|nr:hypothetical protein [Aldersonia kunmingensis]